MANFADLNLHDATLINIEFDWVNALTIVSLKLHRENVVIKFSDCTNVCIPHENSWGQSASVNTTSQDGNTFKIEMQSGDTISVNSDSFCVE
ncbi:hypothetical protein I6F48_04450 [Pseudoalteromonas sp. SWYJ118]|uniref:hypothetical protein n=1 Tax=Pseudoalteromonas sp. SWYJ118 TaxID=2792062 RepID=UPI0018CD933C|nr:hypothetical protein [Pseudoalteromonas sp. SWYJ118]MBH0074815.1 hypothetical protein [Pseudoalteromonas sp. SWYJ118]